MVIMAVLVIPAMVASIVEATKVTILAVLAGMTSRALNIKLYIYRLFSSFPL